MTGAAGGGLIRVKARAAPIAANAALGRMEDAVAESAVEVGTTPYDLVGGAERVRAIVDRFYDLMDQEEGFAELRALHAADLAPMRASLSGFLTGWLGGPRDWFVDNPGKCMMSLHAPIAVTPQTAGQWIEAMRRAITDAAVDPEIAARMIEALTGMARGMIRAPRPVD